MVSSSPFRSAPLDESCDDCRERARVRCSRCGAPLCDSHAPAYGRRCGECEASFEARVNRPAVFLLPLGVWLLGLLSVAASVAITSGVPSFPILVAFGFGALFAAPFVVLGCRGLYFGWSRLRFLRQHHRRTRLPVQYSEESWFEVGESWAPRV